MDIFYAFQFGIVIGKCVRDVLYNFKLFHAKIVIHSFFILKYSYIRSNHVSSSFDLMMVLLRVSASLSCHSTAKREPSLVPVNSGRMNLI